MGQLIYADAIHTVEQSKIDAARITQKASNECQGAEAALANFSAALSNSRRMEAAGSQANDIAGNITRIADDLTKGRLNGRIRAAEEIGAVAAMAGAAGVGGSSVESYNVTVRLQAALKEQAAEAAVDASIWAGSQQRGNAIKAAVATMDNNVYRANLDYTQYIDHKKPSFIERAVGIASTVAATVFAGPQAGAAVAGVFEMRQAARNGDFGNASNAAMGVIQNGYGAIRAAHLTSGPASVNTPAPQSVGTPDYRAAVAALDDPANSGAAASVRRANSFFNYAPDYGAVILK